MAVWFLNKKESFVHLCVFHFKIEMDELAYFTRFRQR